MDVLPDDITPATLCGFVGRNLIHEVNSAKSAGISLQERRKSFITEYAYNIGMLSINIGMLSTNLHSYVTKQLVRPMLESMFNMCAAIHQPTFVESKMKMECEKWLGVLRKQLNEAGQTQKTIDAIKTSITSLSSALAKWKDDVNIQSSRNWTVREICDAGNCSEWYFEYQTLCDHTHMAYSALDPFTKITRGMLLHQATVIAAKTYCDYREFLNPREKNNCLRDAEVLMSYVMRWMNDGTYEKLRWEQA